MEVTSEILPIFENDSTEKPSVDVKHVVSKIRIKCPPFGSNELVTPVKDSDGDYILKRREDDEEKIIILEHSVSTSLELVGLQVWRGALLLADLLVHLRRELVGQIVLDLGAGAGLTSIVAAMYADRVIGTDMDAGEILKLLKENASRNQHLLVGQLTVLGLDWLNLNWTDQLQAEVEKTSIVLAADVVYDNKLTEAFVRTLTKILSTPPRKTVYIALEKRYVFTVADLDSVAPCYEHLLSCMRDVSLHPPWSTWTMTLMPLDFPQRMTYHRVNQLVLWKITS